MAAMVHILPCVWAANHVDVLVVDMTQTASFVHACGDLQTCSS